MALNRSDRFVAVMLKTNGRCYYCGTRVWPGMLGAIDHFVPTSKGGSDDLGNLVPCCRACNSSKGTRTPEEARHNFAIRAAGIPGLTREQIEWSRQSGSDLRSYDSFQFWFETHKTRHIEQRTDSEIRREINKKAKRHAVL